MPRCSLSFNPKCWTPSSHHRGGPQGSCPAPLWRSHSAWDGAENPKRDEPSSTHIQHSLDHLPWVGTPWQGSPISQLLWGTCPKRQHACCQLHPLPHCFRARLELAWKAKQIKCPKLLVRVMSKELHQNQELCPPDKWEGWTDTQLHSKL